MPGKKENRLLEKFQKADGGESAIGWGDRHLMKALLSNNQLSVGCCSDGDTPIPHIYRVVA
ncbi:hypothetical protein AM228_13455 [Planktothricoides sp. SR001]|nr:hypothetical protein AM228_13455 [Planktothricoides sp. SR001]